MSGFLLRLATRNLWRQRRRTVLTFSALSVGIVLLIIMDSLMTGLDDLGTRNLIQLETAHIQVKTTEAFNEKPYVSLDYAFDISSLKQEIQGLAGVEAITPRLHFSAQANTGWEEYGVLGVGIDPTSDPKVFKLQEYLTGSWLAAGANQAVLGAKLAELLDLELGSYVTLLTRAANGAFQALDVEIVGLLNTPHPQVNSGMVYVPIDVARSGLLLAAEQTSELSIWLEDANQLNAVTEQVHQLIAGDSDLQAYSWRESAGEFLAISRSKYFTNYVFLMLLIVIAVVGVVNTILLGALERTREIGMMKAIGLREKEVAQEFLYEALGIGLLGSFFGVAFGSAINWYLVNVGMSFDELIGDIDIGYPIEGVITGSWNTTLIITAFVFGIIVSVLAGIVPALRTAGKDPIWALRQ